MAVEMAIWRMTDAGPRPLKLLPLDFEKRLEKMFAEDPSMSGIDLLIIGRQVRTGYGGYIDLLALDAEVASMCSSSSVIGPRETLLPKHSTTGPGCRV